MIFPARGDNSAQREQDAQRLKEHCEKLEAIKYWTLIAEGAEVCARIATVNTFWASAEKNLGNWAEEYRKLGKEDLFNPPFKLPAFTSKSAASIKNKIQRVGKSMDKSFALLSAPGADGSASLLQFPILDDLVRVRVVCRYLDGVSFLAQKFLELARQYNLSPQIAMQGKIEGYYAQHVYFKTDQRFKVAGVTYTVPVECEIQIGTELSTPYWNTSHRIYEQWRDKEDDKTEWQWNPNDPRFIARQLGHTLHLAVGLLVQLRDSKNKGI